MPTKPSKKPARGATPAVGSAKLEKLKAEFLHLNDVWVRNTAETWWKQGRLLITIKSELPHGSWLPWVEKNLHICKGWTQQLMQIGDLPRLPKYQSGLAFGGAEDVEPRARDLVAIASIVKREQKDVDVVAKEFYAEKVKEEKTTKPRRLTPEEKKARKKQEEEILKKYDRKYGAGKKPPLPVPSMSREDAFLALGIDVGQRTITKESLTILYRGLMHIHHPDKGGSNERSTQLNKAMETLNAN